MGLDIFKYKSPNFNKLLSYGFSFDGDGYNFATRILDGQFEMRVFIPRAGQIKTALYDLGTGEPYTLHLIDGAGGAFVGAVRAECDGVLEDIAQKCFERDVFKSDCAHKIIEYVRAKYGDELEFLWERLPDAAIWRRKDNRKWYGIIMALSKRKLGLSSDETVDIIDLRIDPATSPTVVDGERYFAGYHMNKKSWFTMCLDGSVPVEEICGWLDKSYIIAEKK